MLELTDNKQVGNMPVTPDTLKTRFRTDDYPVYKDFVSFFVSGVVGICRFDRNKCHAKYSTYVSISDEAFAVLTLENNWDRWASMAENGGWTDTIVASKWTTTRDKRKAKRKNTRMEKRIVQVKTRMCRRLDDIEAGQPRVLRGTISSFKR